MARQRSYPQQKPRIVLVTPALAQANNGNWQTAQRWRRFLLGVADVRLVGQWPANDMDAGGGADALIALHARRSAASVAAWAQACPDKGLAVVLTGTDLYRDIALDASAQASLALAHRLVVLQDQGLAMLPAAWQRKARVIYQSVTPRQMLRKTGRWLNVVVVGHLREEKAPDTVFAAVRLLAHRPDIRWVHLGRALDADLGKQAQALMAQCPTYRWLGGVSHEQARRFIQRAHLLIHPSRMEGGAHVVMEAVCSGTPVLASRVDGNVGMLGADYEGLFPVGDAQALANALCRATADADWLTRLHQQCDARRALFTPPAEQAAVRQLAADLLG